MGEIKVAFTQSSDKIRVYDYIEISMTAEDNLATNPFAEIRVSGWFRLDGREAKHVDGFCDSQDGSVYRIRFMPDSPGNYEYGVTLREGNNRRHEHSGRFTARDAGLKGLLKVDSRYPWHFVWEGTGEHYFYNGTTAYSLAGWDDETIRASIDRLSGLKVNRVRVAMSGRVENGQAWCEPVYPTDKFSFCLNPWAARNPDSVYDPNFDVTRFNVAFWQKYERLLAYARERDVIISVVFYVDGARNGVDPFGDSASEDEIRYYRYAVARFGAYSNVTWDISNEYRFFRSEDWAERMGSFIEAKDVYGHLTSIHGFGDFTFRTRPWADFAMYQSWDEAGGNGFMLENRKIQAQTGRIMPQVNEEYGYEEHYPTGWGGRRISPARDADSRRRIAWEISMAGCYQTTGERADTGTGWGSDTGGGWVNGRGDRSMTMLTGYGYMLDFFTSYRWWKSTPHNELVKAYEGADFRGIPYFNCGDEGKKSERTSPAFCLAELGETYAVYLPAGGRATVTLAEGLYKVSLYNPRKGEWMDLPDVSGAEWTSPELADHEDWAFLLTKR